VVLTFLYTNCPDVCPLTAEKLRDARAQVGDQAKDLALIAVSVDPVHDTPAAARDFVRAHRLEGALRFLIGDRASLQRVWAAYSIGQEAGPDPFVGHNDAIYLLDKQGRGRTLLHSDVEVATLAGALRTLLGESRLF
jgi:protein SCO1/2